eukprot:TRINITY_DN1875_c0_g2_i1.p2 TRINITY_DN1875_c0_g2~~TRINITY_DN1875_c0_g2_i1.p2  ORF type:complete len:239 (-),score=67.56 TRINITY_DN1875_c0_g2_i1:141-773(-)
MCIRDRSTWDSRNGKKNTRSSAKPKQTLEKLLGKRKAPSFSFEEERELEKLMKIGKGGSLSGKATGRFPTPPSGARYTLSNRQMEHLRFLNKFTQELRTALSQFIRECNTSFDVLDPFMSGTPKFEAISKGIKKYRCKFCLQEFDRGCSLGGHISRSHKIELEELKKKKEGFSAVDEATDLPINIDEVAEQHRYLPGCVIRVRDPSISFI